MNRYKIETPWRPVERTCGNWPTEWSVDIEYADLRDTRSGRLYMDGAARVTVRNVEGFRTRTFRGETALSKAEQYRFDAIFAAKRAA
jgi:hypothetical protein